jgi:hypothetical protein
MSPSPVQDCPLQKKTWIEIALVGQDGKPVPDARYTIFLADGTKVEGNLDGDGKARVDHIDPGTSVVTFPDLDKGAWKPV